MLRPVLAVLRARFVAGIVVTVPVIATILALRFLLRTLDAILGPAIASVIGRQVPGLGLLATLVLVLGVGMLTANFLGRRLVALVERVFNEVPLVRRVYRASRDIVHSAALGQRMAFREVVMIEYPRKGLFSYAFVTSYTSREGRRFANVFIPGPPLPTTGMLIAAPADELMYLDMTVEEALKLILSAGVAAPPELRAVTRGAGSGGQGAG